ncbi:MAG: sigma 54-interacting transcriptional regulator [Gudongella sp.]|jgi:transcriptional regulator with PAS, ATPase and Fis domain|nr:sigma 54-interacting transcriptional regulator [Gudongella sp.]
MNMLHQISGELQHILEALHAVTNVDMTIVDENLQRVVGTGRHSERIGRSAPENSAFHKCLSTGEQYFIENPRLEAVCSECESKDTCRELVEICLPISYGDEIIGVLGLCAFDEKARDNLMFNRTGYERLEDQLKGIINTMLKERDYGRLLEYRSNELETLINSINEGILIVDNQMTITSVNAFASSKLELDDGIQYPVEEVFPRQLAGSLRSSGFSGELGPVSIKGEEYIIQTNPIETNGNRHGYVLVMSDFKKMKQSVLKSRKEKDLVTFDEIIGESEAIKAARRQAIQVAGSNASVLVIGETGTGKEIFARAIHYAGARSEEVFMPVNCGAIPESLMESELFGYEKGSFTGASSEGKLGIFEVAKNGTLFLDEVGELPLNMQVKLLRALEQKEIVRVGGHKSIKADPRIISATHKDLGEMTKGGFFREDLFYRLNIVPLHIPPLRDRGYDVLILARHFLEYFGHVYQKHLYGFTPSAERLLLAYSFPGNIRELKNLVEYCVIFSNEPRIGEEYLSSKMSLSRSDENRALTELTREFERDYIASRLLTDGDTVEAKKELARQLGISLATLYRKLEDR